MLTQTRLHNNSNSCNTNLCNAAMLHLTSCLQQQWHIQAHTTTAHMCIDVLQCVVQHLCFPTPFVVMMSTTFVMSLCFEVLIESKIHKQQCKSTTNIEMHMVVMLQCLIYQAHCNNNASLYTCKNKHMQNVSNDTCAICNTCTSTCHTNTHVQTCVASCGPEPCFARCFYFVL